MRVARLVIVAMVVMMSVIVRVSMVGVIVRVGMIMLVVVDALLRAPAARVLAEHERFDRHRHGVGRHADALSTKNSSRRTAPSV